MSLRCTRAAWAVLPNLIAKVEAAKGHVDARTVALAHLWLADAYRDDRGWVDESGRQVATAVGVSPSQAHRALAALAAVGVWLPVSHGNSRAASRRAPGFPLPTASGGEPAPLDTASGSEPEGASYRLAGTRTALHTASGPEHGEEGQPLATASGPEHGATVDVLRTGLHTASGLLRTGLDTTSGAHPLTPISPLPQRELVRDETHDAGRQPAPTRGAPPAQPTVGRGGGSAKGNGAGALTGNHQGVALTTVDLCARALAQVVRDYDQRHGDAPARQPLMAKWRKLADACAPLVDGWRQEGAADTEVIAAVAERVGGNDAAIPRSLIGSGNRRNQCPVCTAPLANLTRCLAADGYVPEECPFHNPEVATVERVAVPARTKAENEARKGHDHDPLF